MCNKKSPPPLPLPSCHSDHVRRSSRIHNKVKQEEDDEEEEDDDEITLESLRRAARKSRTKTRKPKYLSLRSQQLIISQDRQQKYRTLSTMTSAKGGSHRQQLNLFPLRPENLVDHQERVDMQEDNVALLFNTDGGGATLNDLLTTNSTATTVTTTTTTTTTSTTMSSDREEHYNDIVRTAMRSREREMSVEKWVCFSELVDKKEDFFTTSSTSTSSRRATDADDDDQLHRRWRSKVKSEGLGLALKLDYQEILNAWSDKGPLYVDGGDAPQTVPDLLHQDHQLFQLHDNTPNGCDGNLWKVPEDDGSLKMKTRHREASVMRYKEKRENRLYAKRIRYQVRKLNADKRPRMRGRFVKKD